MTYLVTSLYNDQSLAPPGRVLAARQALRIVQWAYLKVC
jgi:hypothetical protein